MKTFVISQFSYCPLVWRFHSGKFNNRFNNIRERALRLAYRDYKATFRELIKQRQFCDSTPKKTSPMKYLK